MCFPVSCYPRGSSPPHKPLKSSHAAGLKMVSVIQEIIQCDLPLWRLQNGFAHQTDQMTVALHIQEILTKVKAMYNQKDRLHPEIQMRLFFVPLAEMVTKSHANLEIWLSQVSMLMTSPRARNPHRESHVTDFFCSTARLPGSNESFLSSQISFL